MNVVIPKGVLDLFLKNMFLNLQKLEVSIFHHDIDCCMWISKKLILFYNKIKYNYNFPQTFLQTICKKKKTTFFFL